MKWYWISLIVLTSLFFGMVTYAIIDDVVDEDYSFVFMTYGLDKGCYNGCALNEPLENISVCANKCYWISVQELGVLSLS